MRSSPSGLAAHLAATPEGSRHRALYTIARTLGQLVASGHLTCDQISDALHAAAAANGVLAEDGERNVAQTIADGIAKGVGDGPDSGHHETGERIPYTLLPPGSGGISEARKHLLDIDAVIEAEIDANAQWLIEPIIPAGKSVALYAAGKTGKSLLALDLVAAAASGRPILGGAPLETPINILYVDQEMTQPDLQERLHSLGYTKRDPTLKKHLHYSQLYPWPPLDTKAGGDELLDLALDVGAQLVVIDTLIRTVSGEENSADTIKNFYRHTGMALKEAGIALLRIDHAGKDLTRGQRGTSAKRDDVDVVWLLKPATGNLPGKTMLTLESTSRVNWIPEDIHITRNDGPPLAHVIPSVLQLSSADIEIVDYLQDHGLWGHNVTNRSAREVLHHSTLTAKGTRLVHVVKWMQRNGDTAPAEGGKRGGKREGNAEKAPKGNAEGNASRKRETPRSAKGNARETRGKRENQGEGNITPPPKGGVCDPRGLESIHEVFPVVAAEQVSDAHLVEPNHASLPSVQAKGVAASPPRDAAPGDASAEWDLDFTAPGEATLTLVSPPPPPPPPERAAGDDVEDDVPPAPAPREPDTIPLDEDDLPIPW